MRVLHIVSGLTRANGVSVFVVELAAEQAKEGYDVSILVRTTGSDLYQIPQGIRLVDESKDDEERLRKLVRPDIVHVHALWDPWLTRKAQQYRWGGAKIVWSPHGMLTPWALRNKWPKKVFGLALYQYWALRAADLIHVTAPSEVDDVRRLRLKNDLVVAPLGVRLEVAHGLEKTTASRKTLLFVSRIQRKKGLPNLIAAWAQLPQELRTTWILKIAGPDEDKHLAELKELCGRLGVCDSVCFLGPVFGAAKDSLYREADLFVLPTHSENFGSVVVEALAAGTPVICTKGAPWEELETHKCGKWIEIGVAPLVQALLEMMLLTDATRAEMGACGRALVEARYTWHAVCRTILKSYDNLLAGESR